MNRKPNVHDRLGWNPKVKNTGSQNRVQKRKLPANNNKHSPANSAKRDLPVNNNHQSRSVKRFVRRPKKQLDKPQPTSHCACKSKNITTSTYSNESSNNVNVMFCTIPIFLCFRKITAALNSGANLTKIGEEIANIAVANGFVKKTKTFFNRSIKKTVNVITMPIGTRVARMRPIECIVDPTTPPMGVVLALPAMKSLGYKIVVDRTVAEHHGSGESNEQRDLSRRTQEEIEEEATEEPFVKEEFIEAMTEAEMREIENC